MPPEKPRRDPISRAQIETVISRACGVFGALFGIQSLPTLAAALHETHVVWNIVVVGALYLSLLVGLFTALFQRWVRRAQVTVAVVFLVAVQTWPLAVVDPPTPPAGHYWLYYLLTVATASAAIGLGAVVATTYTVVVPVVYGFIRLTPAGGQVTWQQAVLDSVYAIVLGGTIIVIVTMLRHAAATVDSAQATALERYSTAVRQHATEIERVQVDAIVHDSVLTTLLSAARAYTPEAQELAAQMAANAIGHLREAALVVPDDGSMVRLTSLATRVSDAAVSAGADFELRMSGIHSRSLPVHAAEAVYAAAVQAMVNSTQHAGAAHQVSRWLAIRGLTPTGTEVEIGDDGAGFVPEDVPAERIGLRVSILERILSAGGSADIDSRPGAGTVVTIRWPATAGSTS